MTGSLDPWKILFHNDLGHLLGSVDRVRKSRWTAQGKSDLRQMLDFKKLHPDAHSAHVGSLRFFFDRQTRQPVEAIQSGPRGSL